jgi:hypothetical protein
MTVPLSGARWEAAEPAERTSLTVLPALMLRARSHQDGTAS